MLPPSLTCPLCSHENPPHPGICPGCGVGLPRDVTTVRTYCWGHVRRGGMPGSPIFYSYSGTVGYSLPGKARHGILAIPLLDFIAAMESARLAARSRAVARSNARAAAKRQKEPKVPISSRSTFERDLIADLKRHHFSQVRATKHGILYGFREYRILVSRHVRDTSNPSTMDNMAAEWKRLKSKMYGDLPGLKAKILAIHAHAGRGPHPDLDEWEPVRNPEDGVQPDPAPPQEAGPVQGPVNLPLAVQAQMAETARPPAAPPPPGPPITCSLCGDKVLKHDFPAHVQTHEEQEEFDERRPSLLKPVKAEPRTRALKFEVVERPDSYAGNARNPLILACRATLKTGKAVRVTLNGLAPQTIRVRAAADARSIGAKAHVRLDPLHEHVYVWYVKREQAGAQHRKPTRP